MMTNASASVAMTNINELSIEQQFWLEKEKSMVLIRVLNETSDSLTTRGK